MLGLVGVEKRSVSAKLDLFAQGEEFSIWGGLGRGDCVGRLDADHFFCVWHDFRFVSAVLSLFFFTIIIIIFLDVVYAVLLQQYKHGYFIVE